MKVVTIALLWLLVMPNLLRGEVTVTRAEPVIERKTFDPKAPPADMPKLHPTEAAIAQSYFGIESRVGGSVEKKSSTGDGCRSTVKIDTVGMKLTLRVTIWLPTDAVPKLVNHEEGHRQISEHYYENAEQVARTIANALVGKTITGTGTDSNAAADAALQQAAEDLAARYMSRTDEPSGKAQKIYDRITSHGTNAVKEEKAIKDAIAQATDE